MMDVQASVSWLGQPALTWLADISAKATVVLAVTALAALAWRRASAATRHLLWLCGIVAVLVLPTASRLLPPIAVPVPLLGAFASPAATGDSEHAPTFARATSPADAAQQAPATASDVAAPAARPLALSWPLGLLALWSLGVVAALARVGAGLVTVRWIARGAWPLADSACAAAVADVSARLGLRRPVRLLVSDRATVPMTWGWRRPVVLMPAAARSWDEARTRIVIAHELTHVVRQDAVTQGLARAMCALQWFNPLAWVAAQHLRVERERACDDSVLLLGTRASEYAAELLDIARTQRRVAWPPLAGVAMARPSHLEGRLLAVLDRNRRRGAVTPRAACVAVAVIAMVALPVAAVHPHAARAANAQTVEAVAAPAAAAATPAPAVTAPVAPAAQSSTPATRPQRPAAQAPSRAADTRAAESLAHALQYDEDVKVRRQAAASLGNLPAGVASAAFDALVNAILQDKDPDVRRLSVLAIGHIAGTRAVDALDTALRDEDPRVRLAAALALGQVKIAPPRLEDSPVQAAEGEATGDPFRAGAFKPDGKTVSVPRPIRQVKPLYTREAMRAKIEGTVVVEAIVLPDGSVGDVRVVTSLDPDLDQAAIDCTRQWQFIPAMREGQPVRTFVSIELLFTLR
jgi:TonB family protein